MILLDRQKIMQGLQNKGFTSSFNLDLLSTVDSTNRYLKDIHASQPINICLAERQTQGRGRFQRQWYSPEAENIYCSVRFNIDQSNPRQLSPLSLVTAIALMQSLSTHAAAEGLAIKWPNDILWQDKKLAGILIESLPESTNKLSLIIGIGLNVNSQISADSRQIIDRPWTSVYQITGQIQDRNTLVVNLLIELERHVHQFLTQGFAPFKQQWEAWDYLRGQFVSLTYGHREISGIAQGLTDHGELIITDKDNRQWIFASGETSIKTF